jgi:myo-inositol-1(or 4)-monophosphatase
VSTADGLAYSAFDRSLLATNDALYPQMLGVTEPQHAKLLDQLVELQPWFIPAGYRVRAGAQLD